MMEIQSNLSNPDPWMDNPDYIYILLNPEKGLDYQTISLKSKPLSGFEGYGFRPSLLKNHNSRGRVLNHFRQIQKKVWIWGKWFDNPDPFLDLSLDLRVWTVLILLCLDVYKDIKNGKILSKKLLEITNFNIILKGTIWCWENMLSGS